jgi:hypothetical protein
LGGIECVQPLKGPINCERLSASLKRCPDTNTIRAHLS